MEEVYNYLNKSKICLKRSDNIEIFSKKLFDDNDIKIHKDLFRYFLSIYYKILLQTQQK